jgi:hypothetical protein
MVVASRVVIQVVVVVVGKVRNRAFGAVAIVRRLAIIRAPVR